MRPEVSLSMRWTMPGRCTPPMPERLSPQRYSRALTNVPSGWPGAGCTTMPRALLTMMISSSSYTMSRGIFWGSTGRASVSGKAKTISSPAFARAFFLTGFPFTVTVPASMHFWMRLRERAGNLRERRASIRSPLSSSVICIRSSSITSAYLNSARISSRLNSSSAGAGAGAFGFSTGAAAGAGAAGRAAALGWAGALVGALFGVSMMRPA